MQLRPWAELVTREVRERLPDVRSSARTGNAITWTRGTSRASLTPAGQGLWEFTSRDAAGYRLPHISRRIDVDTAHVAASNLVAHFDDRWCRGIDAEPYSDADMKRFAQR